jgi:hypothetical protein
MAAVTVRNLLFNAVNMAERVIQHPHLIPAAPFEPRKTMEDSAEHHFGRTTRGCPDLRTLKSVAFSTQRLHLHQLRNPVEVKPCRTWSGLSDKEATRLGERAFKLLSCA